MFHLLLGRLPTAHALQKRDWLDSIIGGGFGLINSAMNNMWSLENAKEMADYNKDISKELGLFNFDLQKRGLDYSQASNLEYSRRSLNLSPGSMRYGLELAGYNPILAVNSAGGQSFSNQISPQAPAPSGSSAAPMKSDVLGAIAAISAIRQNNAQTDLIKAKTDSEGWIVKTLSRHEAAGLGASVLQTLGINLHESTADTFLVAYNVRTGKFINLGNTRNGLGAHEPSNAKDLPEGNVDVSIEDRKSDGSYFWKLLTDTPKSPLR